MKISYYLINLDSSVERLQQADAELRKHNIEYERISAVDGRQLDVKTYSNYDSVQANKLMGRDLLGGEIGCYLSHLKCLESFLASDSDYVVVLEDDLEIISNLQLLVQESLVWMKAQHVEWYLLNIGRQKRKFSRKIHQVGQHDLLKAYYFPVRTLGLVWSRVGATLFLQQQNKISAPIDVALQVWLSKNGKGLSFMPALVQPNGAESDIDTKKNNKIPQQIALRTKGNRLPRHKRILTNKYYALMNFLFR